MSAKKAFIMAVLLVAVVAIMAGCTSSSKTVKTGDNVSVDYALSVGNNATIIETNNATLAKAVGLYDQAYDTEYGYNPISFVVGSKQYLPAFENATIGMKVGETKNVTLSPREAYGEFDPAYLEEINMSDFVEAGITPYVNQSIPTMYGPIEVYSIQPNATDYNSSIVTVNINPMAGKTLHFMITLRSINK